MKIVPVAVIKIHGDGLEAHFFELHEFIGSHKRKRSWESEQ